MTEQHAPPLQARSTDAAGHGVLYDGAVLETPPEPGCFTDEHWQQRRLVEGIAGGRGATLLVRWQGHAWVLKHYRRGGFVARLSTDRYVWLGRERTRAYREWRLLGLLWARGLPVPRPIAAHYRRHGLTYSADLITERIAAAEPLSAAMTRAVSSRVWRRIGAMIRRFHAAGVWHADLNAHNILLTPEREYLVDFDRSRCRRGGRWQAANLARLRRSLDKIAAGDARARIDEGDWAALIAGYRGA